ncbi:MAG: hypothetical protein V1494_07630 [Candidatus Diapherotrites archaeon]
MAHMIQFKPRQSKPRIRRRWGTIEPIGPAIEKRALMARKKNQLIESMNAAEKNGDLKTASEIADKLNDTAKLLEYAERLVKKGDRKSAGIAYAWAGDVSNAGTLYIKLREMGRLGDAEEIRNALEKK